MKSMLELLSLVTNGKKVLTENVNEESNDMVRFVLDTERAYNAVMEKFGDLIAQDDNDYMVVSRKLWPKIEQVAYDADGIGAEAVDDDLVESKKNPDFDEPLTGYHIVYRKSKNPVVNTPSFETKEAAQKYLMTKMFKNHQDYQVVHTSEVGINESQRCNHTSKGTSCPVHGLNECPMNEDEYTGNEHMRPYWGLAVNGVVKFKFQARSQALETAAEYSQQFPQDVVEIRRVVPGKTFEYQIQHRGTGEIFESYIDADTAQENYNRLGAVKADYLLTKKR